MARVIHQGLVLSGFEPAKHQPIREVLSPLNELTIKGFDSPKTGKIHPTLLLLASLSQSEWQSIQPLKLPLRDITRGGGGFTPHVWRRHPQPGVGSALLLPNMWRIQHCNRFGSRLQGSSPGFQNVKIWNFMGRSSLTGAKFEDKDA